MQIYCLMFRIYNGLIEMIYVMIKFCYEYRKYIIICKSLKNQEIIIILSRDPKTPYQNLVFDYPLSEYLHFPKAVA